MKPLFPLLAVTLLAATPHSFAQVAPPNPPEIPALVPLKPAPTRFIRLKNVKPSLMAYWLDPLHNEIPQSLRSPQNENSYVNPYVAPKAEKGAFELPGASTQLVGIDPQNVLLVAGGTDEDVRRLQEIIDILDQPLRQIELDARVVEISAKDLKSFDLEFPAPSIKAVPNENDKAPSEPRMVEVRGHIQVRLNALVANKSARLLASPQLTALNNYSATISLAPPIPSARIFDAGHAPLAPVSPISNQIILNVTPTINGDDTLTLRAQIIRNERAEPGVRGLDSVINLRDGNAVAITGLAPLFDSPGQDSAPSLDFSREPTRGVLFRPKAAPDSLDGRNIVIFLTARIVRRAE